MLEKLINAFNQLGIIGFVVVALTCVLLTRNISVKIRDWFVFRVWNDSDDDKS